MNVKHRVIYSGIAILLALFLLAACSSNEPASPTASKPSNTNSTGDTKASDATKEPEAVAESNRNDSGFPIVKEPIKLRIFSTKSNSNLGNWNETTMWQAYKEMTNIDADFQLVPVAELAEKRNLALAGGQLPDVFHTARLGAIDIANYGSQGIFIPLNDLIDQHAPHLKKILEEQPEVRKGLTMPDGNIYSFPSLLDPSFTSSIIGSQLWVNEQFLETLNMEMPTTIEGYYEYLKAVKTQDPNKNGLQDEIPFLASGITMLYDHIKGAWGLGNRGNTHPRVDVDPVTNELRFIPSDPNNKEVLQFLNRLKEEELFYQDIFTVSQNDVTAAFQPDMVGSSLYTNPNMTYPGISGFTGVATLEGPNGDRLFSRARSPMVLLGGMTITNANPYPAETVRWVDYFYSDEGSRLFRLGVEGVSYEQVDGKYQYTETLRNDPSQLGKHITWAGGWYPGMDNPNYIISSESEPENIRVSELIKPDFPDELWPEFTYSSEEVMEFIGLGTDINAYVDEMTAKFINGTTPFSEWDTYVATLNKMGLERYMAIYSAAAERYNNN